MLKTANKVIIIIIIIIRIRRVECRQHINETACYGVVRCHQVVRYITDTGLVQEQIAEEHHILNKKFQIFYHQ